MKDKPEFILNLFWIGIYQDKENTTSLKVIFGMIIPH
jgi:hypothetical protein